MHVVIVYVFVIVVYPVPETTRGQVLGTRVVRMVGMPIVPRDRLLDRSAVVVGVPILVPDPVVTSDGGVEVAVVLTLKDEEVIEVVNDSAEGKVDAVVVLKAVEEESTESV